MTIKKVIQQLREKGYKVEFYTRKDGGVRVTNVNGIKFSSKLSDGNAYAQQLLGVATPSKQYEQRIKAGESAKQLAQTSKDFQKAFKKAQKEARTGRTPKKITWKDTKDTLRKLGEKKTLAVLKDQVRHAQGKAYTQHWATVYQYLDDHPELDGYAERFEPLEDTIPVETVDKLINALYSYDKGAMSEEEIKQFMENILAAPEKIRSKRAPKYAKPLKPRFFDEKSSEALDYEINNKEGK